MPDAIVNSCAANASTDIDPSGLIGPNSVIQLGEALRTQLGRTSAQRIYEAAGCLQLFDTQPEKMIDERVPARLFRQLWRSLSASTARAIALDAGRRTGSYILEHRIPSLAHVALRALPRSYACRLLLSAIEKNAWTFAGSGTCRTTFGIPMIIEIAHNPLRMPDGVWHRAVFAELFGALISCDVDVHYVAVPYRNAVACRFEICVGAEADGVACEPRKRRRVDGPAERIGQSDAGEINKTEPALTS